MSTDRQTIQTDAIAITTITTQTAFNVGLYRAKDEYCFSCYFRQQLESNQHKLDVGIKI